MFSDLRVRQRAVATINCFPKTERRVAALRYRQLVNVQSHVLDEDDFLFVVESP
jgi:hypothetical protein